jgi:hypothetical protein
LPAVSIPAIDVASLPGPAQKILDPNGPAPLKAMAAKGLMPGLGPGAMLAVVVTLSKGSDGNAETARTTLEKLPPPLLNGALALPDLHPAVLDALGPMYAKDAAVSEKVLHHPQVQAETVAAMAMVGSEGVCELIATNEERLLANPTIIEKLYMNKSCRMSTADRILELAVRNGLDLGIPAFAEAKQAIQGELIPEPSEEPTFDDQQFETARSLSTSLALGEDEDTHEVNPETGQEVATGKARPLQVIWGELTAPQKIRLINLAAGENQDSRAVRMLGVRDANPIVAVAALKAPGMNDVDAARIASLRNVAEDVLREIANRGEWTRHYMVKLNLVSNPRTPFNQASKFVMHLRENDIKNIAKSKEVPGAVQTAAKQQLQRKGK